MNTRHTTNQMGKTFHVICLCLLEEHKKREQDSGIMYWLFGLLSTSSSKKSFQKSFLLIYRNHISAYLRNMTSTVQHIKDFSADGDLMQSTQRHVRIHCNGVIFRYEQRKVLLGLICCNGEKRDQLAFVASRGKLLLESWVTNFLPD